VQGAEALAGIISEAPAGAGKIEVVQLDVSDAASVAAAAATVKAALGGEPLYGIVNNAGAGLAQGGVTEEQVVDVNLYGCKRVCDAFVPLLAAGGRVVNLGSGLGPGWMSRASEAQKATLCSPDVTWEQVVALAAADLASQGQGQNGAKGSGMNAYGLSKAALMSLTTILARSGVVASTVSPGFVDTNMTKGFGAPLTPEQGTASIRHALLAELKGNGFMYGSDCLRAPIDASRDPGDPEYTDPTGRGW